MNREKAKRLQCMRILDAEASTLMELGRRADNRDAVFHSYIHYENAQRRVNYWRRKSNDKQHEQAAQKLRAVEGVINKRLDLATINDPLSDIRAMKPMPQDITITILHEGRLKVECEQEHRLIHASALGLWSIRRNKPNKEYTALLAIMYITDKKMKLPATSSITEKHISRLRVNLKKALGLTSSPIKGQIPLITIKMSDGQPSTIQYDEGNLTHQGNIY